MCGSLDIDWSQIITVVTLGQDKTMQLLLSSIKLRYPGQLNLSTYGLTIISGFLPTRIPTIVVLFRQFGLGKDVFRYVVSAYV